jgi:uncharacterized protein YdhG (YjbR/CyaY superfamily)
VKKFKTVEDYLASLPKETREKVEQLRKAIRETAPKAEEIINYNMPAFRLEGVLVWYAAYKNHIGFYPKTSPIKFFKKELEGYKTSKGAIQFPLDKSVPIGLVKKIVKFRIKENAEDARTKASRKR